MKKSILTTTLVLGLGVSGIAASGQNAEASEINEGELAQLAQSNASELNEAPLHEGAYEYNFNVDNVDYNFSSDGNSFSWSYGNYEEAPQQEVSEPAPEQNNNVQEEQTYETEEVVYEEVQEQPQEQTTQEQPQQSNDEEASAPAPSQSSSSNDGSVKSQFLSAGGTEELWNSVVVPESGGDPSAVSPNGYQGLGQTKESWGTGSVESQTQGMVNYAKERYGSVEAATSFRESNNWW